VDAIAPSPSTPLPRFTGARLGISGRWPVVSGQWAVVSGRQVVFEYEYEYRFTEYEYEYDGNFFWGCFLRFRTCTQSALADGTRTRTRF